MKQTKFFRIEENGQVFSVDQRMEELKLGDGFPAMLGGNIKRIVYGAIGAADISPDLKGSPHSASGFIYNEAGDTVWSMQLPAIPINTHFKVWDDGTLTPSFSQTSNPLMSVLWAPPANMRVIWVVVINKHQAQARAVMSPNQYLVATDTIGAMYRIPLSNLYEDCRLCTGAYDSTAKTHLDCLRKAWHQFATAEWQGDLYDSLPDTYRARTDMMFRYKAGKEKGFDQQPPTFPVGKDWRQHSDTVATEWLTNNVIIY